MQWKEGPNRLVDVISPAVRPPLRLPPRTAPATPHKMAAALARVGATRATATTTMVAAAAATAAGLASVRTKVTLPQLPYNPAALEPVISAQIMELHHSKHHAAYVNNYNAAEEKLNEALAKGDLAGAIALQPALRFNGGGHINHSIFWTNLAPPKEGGGEGPTGTPPRGHFTWSAGARARAPRGIGCGISLERSPRPRRPHAILKRRCGADVTGALFDAIKAQWGSFDAFKTEFNNAAAAVQGSGWGWLVRCRTATNVATGGGVGGRG